VLLCWFVCLPLLSSALTHNCQKKHPAITAALLDTHRFLLPQCIPHRVQWLSCSYVGRYPPVSVITALQCFTSSLIERCGNYIR